MSLSVSCRSVDSHYVTRLSCEQVVEQIGAGLHKCTVPIGTPEHQQSIIYVDTEADIPEYDGHHLAIYLDDYPGAYSASAKNDLICAYYASRDM